MMSFGTPAGANRPLKFAATMPGNPASMAVGMSGAAWQPLVRGDRQDADLAGGMELQERPADIRRHHRDVAGGEIGHARRRAFVRNVGDVLHADQLLEQLARKIGHGAGAGRAVGQLGRIGSGRSR